jgi:hypothetical protein
MPPPSKPILQVSGFPPFSSRQDIVAFFSSKPLISPDIMISPESIDYILNETTLLPSGNCLINLKSKDQLVHIIRLFDPFQILKEHRIIIR